MKQRKGAIAKDTVAVMADTIPYLLHWYDYNKRILPWREEPTPYHVWVSEIMLQQTRVEAVRGYYARFLEKLPTITDLAKAPEEELLKLWEGLGYYSRVRNLQKAAKTLCEQYHGELPGDYGQLRKLPGIGTYTAGAIASIAFGIRVPAVDGNVLRIVSRITGDDADIAAEATKKKRTEELLRIMPKESGEFNQAMMDLGATICIPNGKPFCDKCPVSHLCVAHKEGLEDKLPVKTAAKARKVEKRVVFLLNCGERELLHKRPDTGLLAGLWEYPGAETEHCRFLISEKETACLEAAKQAENREKDCTQQEYENVRRAICDRFHANSITIQKGRHVFSHIEWQMLGIELSFSSSSELMKQAERLSELLCHEAFDETRWALAKRSENRENYPMPSAFDSFRKKGEGKKDENRNRL